MKKQYLLPAGCALAFHAILLLGFNGTPPKSTVTIEDGSPVIYRPPTVDIVDYVPPPAEPDNDDPMPKPKLGNPDAGNPGLPDPPVPTGFKDFVMETTQFQSRIWDAKKIKPGVLGVPNGLPDGIPGVHSVVDFSKLDKRPQSRVRVAPVYPTEAKMRGAEGEVLVGFTVDVEGRVMSPHVIKCTDSAFAQPALQAVSKWRFMPGRMHGRLVSFRMAVPIVFRLND